VIACTVSPGSPTTRLTNVTLAWCARPLARRPRPGVEDDHIAAVGIGEPRQEARGQHAIALVDRWSHRSGGDAVRLDDVLLDEPGQAQREHDDDHQLDHRRKRRGVALSGREAQLDSLGAPLALGRSGHAIG
jgi:hypothetical protein